MNGRNMTEKDLVNAKLMHTVHYVQIMNKSINLAAIMDDRAGRNSICRREMGNNEFSWHGLIFI